MKQPELGKKVLELRLSKGFTQNELAEKCNLSIRTIQRIELGEVIPRSFTLKTIFSVLDYEFYDAKTVSQNAKTLTFKETILEIFNLKKNTMKKLSFLSVLLVLGLFFMFKNESQAQTISGWTKAGSKSKSYEMGLDNSVTKTGKKCAYLKSVDSNVNGFGTIMQKCEAKFYLGKRIKMIGFVKTENVDKWSGMWLRVDSKYGGKPLSFDNMSKRPLKGNSDWTKCEIILNVPQESSTLNFGLLLDGTGMVWFDKISFEIIGDITDEVPKDVIPDKPSNIDFED
jgi:transcriptional regulator with XRE-family HTH domain